MLDPLIRLDGTAFPLDQLKAVADVLATLSKAERESFRNANASAIAQLNVPRVLLVSGPGTGKSTIFLNRIKYWLSKDPTAGVLVTSFVRKLVQDLQADVDRDEALSDTQRNAIRVFTLHKLARSLVEQNHGTTAWPFRAHFKIIGGPWKQTVWDDVLCFHPELNAQTHTLLAFERRLHKDEMDGVPEWDGLKATYFALCRFFNAAGFADLILRARDAIREHPELVPETYLVVDEYQDFNQAEQELLETLCKGATGVLFAGDDDQVLYETLKAGDADLVRSLYANEQTVNGMLPLCGRCNFHITSSAGQFIRAHADDGRIRKLFMPIADPDDARVEVISFAAPSSVVAHVLSWLSTHESAIRERAAAIAAGTAKDPYVLILTHSKKLKFLGSAKQPLLDAIAELQTATAATIPEDYFNVAVYYSVGRYPHDNFELRKALALDGVSATEVHVLIETSIEAQANLCDLEYEAIQRAMERGRLVVAACAEEADPTALADRLATIIKVSDPKGLAAALQNRPLTESAIQKLREDTDVAAEAMEAPSQARALELISVVGAKGLSADHVILLGCDNVSLGYVTPKAFFVGLTRGRKSLQLLVSTGAGGGTAVHPFVSSLDERHVRYRRFTKADGLQEVATKAEFERRIVALAARRGKPTEPAI